MSDKTNNEQAWPFVLVTTKHRGVFAGELVTWPSQHMVVLRGARNCIYWRSEHGFLGLASAGPTKECKIGARVPGDLRLYDITSIAECTADARRAWEAA